MPDQYIFRQPNRRRFVMVDQVTVDDQKLSWKGTGLLTYLLGLPDDWQVNSRDLANRKTDGKDSTQSGMRELERLGYLHRTKRNGPKGFIYEVRVYERPWPGNPAMGNPAMGNPAMGNPPLPKTQRTEDPITNTQEEKTKEDVRRVFDVWETSLGPRKRAKKLTPNRQKCIRARLKSFSVEDLVLAVGGWVNDDWAERPKHNDITLICRNDETVEKFLAMAEGETPRAEPGGWGMLEELARGRMNLEDDAAPLPQELMAP